MSEIFLSVHQQSPGQVAAPVTLTGQIADPPADLDRLGHGDLLQGRVVGQDQAGRMLVKTDLGVLKIATPQALPEGTEVTLQIRHAGAHLQVLILRTQPSPPQAGAPPVAPPSEADGRAPLPDAVVRGQPIKAIIQAPTSTATPLPGVPARIAPGTELAVRVTSVGALSTPPAVATGTATPGPQTVPGTAPVPLGGIETLSRPASAASPPHAASTAQPPPGGASVATNAGANAGRATASGTGAPSNLAAPGSPPGPASAAQPPAAVSVVEAARSVTVALDSATNKPTVLNAHPIRPGAVTPHGAVTPPSTAVRPLAPAAIAASLPTPSGGEAAPLRITGQVTGMTRAGQPILQTALGIITLATPTTLPAGGSVALEIVGLSNAAMSSTGTAAPASGRAGGGSATLPVPGTGMVAWGPRLVPAILLFLAAIKGGRISNWLAGTDAGDPWGPSGLDGDKPGPDASAFVRRVDNAAGEWRLFLLPLLHAGLRSQVRLYLRSKDGEDAAPGVLGRHKATRFVIEAEISSLGGVQFDGFVAAKRFDLNFRSRVPVGPVLRLGIAEIYEAALSSEGWTGQLNFARLGKGGLWGTAQGGSSEVLI
jgi:hypothetical protein